MKVKQYIYDENEQNKEILVQGYTVLDIARALNTSKQVIYRIIKANNFIEALPETPDKNNTKYYNQEIFDKIKEIFEERQSEKERQKTLQNASEVQQNTNEAPQKNTSETPQNNEVLQKTLIETVDFLKKQLQEKDDQIEKLHKLIDQEQQLRMITEQKLGFFERLFKRSQ